MRRTRPKPSRRDEPPARAAAKTVDLTLKDLRTLEKSLAAEHSVQGLKKLLDMYHNGAWVLSSAWAKYNIPSAAIQQAHALRAPGHPPESRTTSAAFPPRQQQQQQHRRQQQQRQRQQRRERRRERRERRGEKPRRLPLWRTVGPLIVVFMKATLSLVKQATEMSLLAFIFKELEHYIPFLVPFPKVAKSYLKALLQLWGTSQSDDADTRSVQISAFFRIRQLAILMPFPFIEDSLKGLYLTFVRNARFVNEQSLQAITFIGNCVVELFGVDTDASYQHCFVYVRQLALHLRNAMIKKTKEALQAVFNWQYLHCLRVWAKVIAEYPGEDQRGNSCSPCR